MPNALEPAMSAALGSFVPSISVIINTDGRAKSLATCLESLRYLRYPNFEVVVVAGPTRDGTHELCAGYGAQIRFADCPERNLSMSRNISIHVSSGQIVAFLDDDSVPEPEWLDDVVPAFRDTAVAVAGGFLHDHTGKTYQWTFGTLDRFGTADTSWTRAAPELNFPGSFNYPHVMANSLFRRSAIVEVGGFDEEYEYFLDESDIILRFVDAGWKVAQLDKGFIHHKFMASHLRNESRVLTSWYSVLKNKTYFSLLNGGGHTTIDEVLNVIHSSVEEFRNHVKWAINERLLEQDRMVGFEEEVDRALRDGLSRGLVGKRKLVAPESLKGTPGFVRFASRLPAAEQNCYVFLTKTYPPGSVGGIGRFTHHLAKDIARAGHQVNVLTEGSGHDRVDFEDGVWVHRICIKEFSPPEGLVVPAHVWNYSKSMLEEALAIADRRQVLSVCAPIWDVEGIAFLENGQFKLFTLLQTTLAMYLESNPEKRANARFIEDFADPVLELERKLSLESDGVIAHSRAIVEEMERLYSLRIPPAKLAVVPLGLDDWTSLRAEQPPALGGKVRVCFVGRLESRKGADVFLAIVPRLLQTHPNMHIDIVGNDSIPFRDGPSLRQLFERAHPDLCSDSRVVFHGEVSEDRLRGFYSSADVVVAPSRFESFGLVHLEAMMHGKVVIGCNVGGMKEVIEHEVSGLLATPGDEDSLLAYVEKAVADPSLREELGLNARKAYLERFTARTMAENTMASISRLLTRNEL